MQLETPVLRSPLHRAMARLARVDVRLTLARVALPAPDAEMAGRLARALDAAGIIAAPHDAREVLLLYVGPRSVTTGDDAVTADLATRAEAALATLGAPLAPVPRFAATHFWSAEVGDVDAACTRLGAEPTFRLRVRTGPSQPTPAPLAALAS